MVGLLDELIDLRKGALKVEWDDGTRLTFNDLQGLIGFVATS